MSLQNVSCTTFDEHPHTHLFTAPDPAGSVLFRTDVMQQVACSPRGGELAKTVLSGRTSSDALPPAVREILCRPPSTSPFSAASSPSPTTDYTRTLYLVPTLDCQLRCTYCRITREQGHQAGSRMSPESACDAIDHVFRQTPDEAQRTVVFFGGEPLLVPETVFSAISHIRKRPQWADTHIMLQTNGIAIDARTAEFLAAHDVFVLLSLDGTAELHDRHRLLSTGGGSYRKSVAGYRNAKQYGCRVGISATATKETADTFTSSFETMLADLLPDKCGAVTHLHPMTAARSPHQCSPSLATDILTETFLTARRMGIYHQQMCERIEPLMDGTWRHYSCAGCSGKVVVAPNGAAGICEYNAGDERSYVPLDQFSPDTAPDFLRWAGRSPLNTRECLRCPALPTCGGGCAYDSQQLMGDALKFDPWLCETNVQVIRWLMRDLLSHLQDKVRGQDFHVVTPQDRALLLGNIALDAARAPMPSVSYHRDVPEPEQCQCSAE